VKTLGPVDRIFKQRIHLKKFGFLMAAFLKMSGALAARYSLINISLYKYMKYCQVI